MFDAMEGFVQNDIPPHLRDLWCRDIETQVRFTTGETFRIPKDGKAESLVGPNYDDHDCHPSFTCDNVAEFGTSGWDWCNKQSLFGRIDLDGLNHAAGHDDKTLDDIVHALAASSCVSINRSKSGTGYHVTVFFDPDDAPRAETREQHIANIKRIAEWLSVVTQIDLTAKADCIGVICWLHHHDRGEHGFESIKKATENVPTNWHRDIPLTFAFDDEPAKDFQPLPKTPKHEEVTNWLSARGMGEWNGDSFQTHTFSLLLAAEALGIKDGFATLATGKEGPSDRNCFMFPDANGSWRVFRHHKGTKEHDSWWLSKSGWTTRFFNRSKQCKSDPTSMIVGIGTDDELFRDPYGNAFVTTKLHGIDETMQINDRRYKAKLRMEYTSKTGEIATATAVLTALDQIEAIALLDRPEFATAIRIAEHGGKLYIDLADRERQIIEVDRKGWRVATSAPVRFVRPYGLLPLPMPVVGGTLSDLKKFVNVEDDDLPLLLAFIVSCFHPSGPYALLSIMGEQGSAKSALMRFLHDHIDPQISLGSTIPKNERDLLVTAQYRRLISFDNVDSLNRQVSSLLCMLCTGATSANRKLFTDADQAILAAKRPIILTSIANVVTASDLLDRTISLVLPPIPSSDRKTEFAIEQELRKDGTRGKILGYILDAVAAALAGHDKVDRTDIPRLADVFTWAIAAEERLGCGSILEAYKEQRAEAVDLSLDENPFAKKIIAICKEGFDGSPEDLTKMVKLGLTSREIGNQIRDIAPDLRTLGFVVQVGKSGGKRFVRLGKQGKAS